jgi:hypothetical protein
MADQQRRRRRAIPALAAGIFVCALVASVVAITAPLYASEGDEESEDKTVMASPIPCSPSPSLNTMTP